MTRWEQCCVLLCVLFSLISCATDNDNEGTTTGQPTDVPEAIEDTVKTETLPEQEIESKDIPQKTEELPTPLDAQLGDGQEVVLNPPPLEPGPRSLKRVNLDQLQSSIIVTTGLKNWVANTKNLIEKNAAPLGRPDYETSVMETLQPGLLFDKLLGDSAREICPLLIEKEKTAPKDDRIFIKYAAIEDTMSTAPELIEKNMRMLLLRFHGTYLPAGSKQLEPWLTLFETATNDTESPEALDGWSVICTTLIVHPDFISY